MIELDRVTPTIVEGDLILGYSHYGVRHAVRARIVDADGKRYLSNRLQDAVCADYRAKDGRRLAKHDPSRRGSVPVARPSVKDEYDSEGRRQGAEATLWADVPEKQRCPHCVKVLLYPPHGQPPTDMTVVAEARDVMQEIADNPLARHSITTRQESALRRLVENDYAQVEARIRLEHEQYTQSGLKGVDDEFSDEAARLQRVREQMNAAIAHVNDDVAKLAAKLESDEGVSISRAPVLSWGGEVRVAGKQERLREFKAKADAALRLALRTLAERKAAAQRQILLAVVDRDLVDALKDSMPSASEVFQEAMEGAKEVEDGRA